MKGYPKKLKCLNLDINKINEEDFEKVLSILNKVDELVIGNGFDKVFSSKNVMALPQEINTLKFPVSLFVFHYIIFN